jgi:hypothetical protein
MGGCKFIDNGGGTPNDGGFDGFSPQGPLLVATPTSADFGAVNVGSKSASKTITVANSGPGTTGALAVTLSGGSAFVVDSDGCTQMSLATTGSCSVTVHFAPSMSGAQSASLEVSSSPGGNVVVSLSGTGAGAGVLSISPAMKDFGSVEVGSMSAPSTFTVTNTGTAQSGAVTVALSGSDAAHFALSPDLCTGKTLAPMATCTVGVTAYPTSPGSKAATLTAQAAGDNGTATASLAANGLAAVFVITPPSFAFGPVTEGSPPASKTFTVENVGNQDAGAPMLAVTGPNAGDFTLSANMCTSGLGSMGTCTFAIDFAPTTPMGESATVTASATNVTSGQASLTGTGQASSAHLTISPTSQPLGSVVQGGTGTDFPFMVSNDGASATGPLTVAISGTMKADFALGMDGCTGQTLAIGASCTVNAHFAPGASSRGGESATLTVGGNPGGSATATLSGTALAAAQLSIAQVPVPQWTGVPVGTTSAPVTFTVQNTGDEPTGTISFATSGTNSADFVAVAPNPCTGPLQGGQSCMFQMEFLPSTAAGTESATLEATSATGGTGQASLEGTAFWVLTLKVVSDTTVDPPNGIYCYPQYVRSATVTGSNGMACSIMNGSDSTCSWVFADQTMVTIAESTGPSTYATFSWQGCTPTMGVSTNPCTFPMTSNLTVTADFCGNGG